MNLYVSNVSGMRPMDSLHSGLDFFKEWGGVVNGGSPKYYPDSRIRLVDLMDTQRFFVGGATHNEHDDVLGPTPIGTVLASQRGVKILSEFAFYQIF